jgi:hypothetical protein
MSFRILLCALLTTVLAACQAPYKKADEKEKQPLKDVSGDTSFQAFTGRLRLAVQKRDRVTLATMMAPDFGYTWDPQPGETAFAYWDREALWPVLEGLLRQNFVPSDLYMVSPPELVSDPNYNGPRCGMRQVGGSWKFAYFLTHGG